MAERRDLLDHSVSELLEGFASEEPTPGSGSAAALVVAMSAGLTAAAARAAERTWADARAIAAQAEAIRNRVAPLVQIDADAYQAALAAVRLPQELEPEVRATTIGSAMARAAEVPLAIVEAAADAAVLAGEVVGRGSAERSADAASAAALAAGAARAASNLVVVNLGMQRNDHRLAQARQLVSTAEEAAGRALAAASSP